MPDWSLDSPRRRTPTRPIRDADRGQRLDDGDLDLAVVFDPQTRQYYRAGR